MKLTMFEEALIAFAVGYAAGCVLAVLPPRLLIVGTIVSALVLLLVMPYRNEKTTNRGREKRGRERG
jgi:hypothetical protein